MPDKNQTLTAAVIEAREQHESTQKQKDREEKDAGNASDADRSEPVLAQEAEKEDAQEYREP